MKNFKILGFICLAILINNKTHAQEKGTKADDIESIKKMCGCFEVSFNFAETYSENENYEFYDRYSAKLLRNGQLLLEKMKIEYKYSIF